MTYYTEIKYKIANRRQLQNLKLCLFEKFFKKIKGKILDVGCSIGNFLAINPNQIKGIDIDNDAIRICKKRGLNAQYMDLNKKLKFKKNSFEGIFCSHVIEHLPNPFFSLKEIWRILKPGGKMVLITPDYIMTHHKQHKGFWSDYTHVHPFIKESLEKIAYVGFRKYQGSHAVKSFRGRGILLRKKIISLRMLEKIEKFLGMKSSDLVLEAIK